MPNWRRPSGATSKRRLSASSIGLLTRKSRSSASAGPVVGAGAGAPVPPSSTCCENVHGLVPAQTQHSPRCVDAMPQWQGGPSSVCSFTPSQASKPRSHELSSHSQYHLFFLEEKLHWHGAPHLPQRCCASMRFGCRSSAVGSRTDRRARRAESAPGPSPASTNSTTRHDNCFSTLTTLARVLAATSIFHRDFVRRPELLADPRDAHSPSTERTARLAGPAATATASQAVPAWRRSRRRRRSPARSGASPSASRRPSVPAAAARRRRCRYRPPACAPARPAVVQHRPRLSPRRTRSGRRRPPAAARRLRTKTIPRYVAAVSSAPPARRRQTRPRPRPPPPPIPPRSAAAAFAT